MTKLERRLRRNMAVCKLTLLGLMWLQQDEDSYLRSQGEMPLLAADYSSHLEVTNEAWLENTDGIGIRHFGDISNTQRIGVLREVLDLLLTQPFGQLPTCVHDAAYFSLSAIALIAVEKELSGQLINKGNEYFARQLVLECLQDLANPYILMGHPYLDYPLSLDEVRCLLPPHIKDELEISLQEYIAAEPDLAELIAAGKTDCPGYYFKDFFEKSTWKDNLNSEAVAALQQKYGRHHSEVAVDILEKDGKRWGMTLVYLRRELGANTLFTISDSDLTLSETELLDMESSNIYEDEGIPTGYFRIKLHFTKWSDRLLLLPSLVQMIVFYFLTGKNNNSHLEALMSVPMQVTRITTGFPVNMSVAAYKSGYYMTLNCIEEWEVGSNWLFKTFSSLRSYYERGCQDCHNH